MAGAEAQPRTNDANAAVRPLCAERSSPVDARGTFARRGTVKRAATSDARRRIRRAEEKSNNDFSLVVRTPRARAAHRGETRARSARAPDPGSE